MDQDPEECMEGAGSDYFMRLTMVDMPECVIDIFDTVGFKLLLRVGTLRYDHVSYRALRSSPNSLRGTVQMG